MFGVAPTSSRPRSSRSCARCACRKVKCDKTRPTCSRCAKGSLQCSYAAASNQAIERVIFIDETSAVVAEYASLHGRVNRLDEMLNDLGQRGGMSGGIMSNASNNSEGQDFSDELGHLYLGPQSKSRYVSPDFFAMISQEVTEINYLLQQQQQYTVDPELHVLREEQDYTLQNGSYRRGSVSTDNPGFHNKTITGQLCGDIFPYPPAWALEDSMARSTARIYSPGVILDDLPSKEQCETLIWTYMKGYHTISPLFHGPSFLQQARKYIERADVSRTDVDLHFVALLTAVLFAGCAICSRKRLSEVFGGQSRENLSSHYYRCAVRAIRLTNFPQTPSLYTLSAFIIVDTTWLREEQPLTCCSFVGLATRVAQMLGLHNDPARFPDISPIYIQVRRQLWWSLFAIDAQVSLASGLPPIVDCNSCQVQDFSEIPEDMIHLGVHSRIHPKSIHGLLVGGKVEFYKNASKILHVIHSGRFSREDLDYILEIIRENRSVLTSRQQQISEIERTLASPMSLMNDYNEMTILRESQSNPVLARFAKAVLSLFTVKLYAIIQGPVRRNNLYSYLLEKDPEAITGCKKYLHGFLKITQSYEFQPWHWRWPGQHQPLHSIMTLILHLDQSPDDATARETRKLVDLAIFMCGPQENHGILSSEDGNFDSRALSASGSKVWEFIRQARAKVWTKAGLDPIILNCPERAEDINIDQVEGSEQPTPETLTQLEDPFESLGAWSGGNEDGCTLGVDGNFGFDASLFFTGEV